jgi:hypothetical protein
MFLLQQQLVTRYNRKGKGKWKRTGEKFISLHFNSVGFFTSGKLCFKPGLGKISCGGFD